MMADQPDYIQEIARLYPRLMRVMARLRGAADDTLDLTYNQYKALLTLSDSGPCTLNSLSRELGVATSSASQMVDRLVIMGLVERTQAEGDRRRVILETSSQGEDLLEKIRRNIGLRYEGLFRHLEESEQASLTEAIHTLVGILEKAIEEEKEK